MKKLTILVLCMLFELPSFCQEDGGNLCHGDDINEKPIWILRFNIIDIRTHNPVRYANVEIYSKSRGDGIKWHANKEGVAVFVALDPRCIPDNGTIEISSQNYIYYSQPIDRNYFRQGESDKRIYLEGHHHNWTDYNRIPKTQEIVDKISAKRYQVGVKTIDVGYASVNFAPACFEYEIEMERTNDGYIQDHYKRNDQSQNYSLSKNENQFDLRNNVNNESDIPNGWHKLPKNQFGDTYFAKGKFEVRILGDKPGIDKEGETFVVIKYVPDEDQNQFIDSSGNVTTNFKQYSESEAFSIAYSFMKNH
jgi:hypothetical protein